MPTSLGDRKRNITEVFAHAPDGESLAVHETCCRLQAAGELRYKVRLCHGRLVLGGDGL